MKLSEQFFQKITVKSWHWEGAKRSSPSHEEMKIYGKICELEGRTGELRDAVYGLESNLMDVPHTKEERKFAKCEAKHHRIRLKEIENEWKKLKKANKI